jgi:hypothetical protein
MTAPLTRDTINTIKKNAGRVPATQIAASLGWPLDRVERVAREQGYDLRVDAPQPTPIEQLTAAGNPFRKAESRYGNITVNLSNADYETMVAKAKEHKLRRATLFAALVKGALASGTLDALVTAGRKELGQ